MGGAGHRVACAVLVCLVSPPVVTAAEEIPPHADFSGSWEFNQERSDDPAEKVAEVVRDREPPRSLRSRARGGAASSDDRQELRQQIEGLITAPRVVNVVHEDPTLIVESALPESPYKRTLHTDGREFTYHGAEASAGWGLGGRLVVEYETGAGQPVKETWELVAEGSRVLITTEFIGTGLVPSVRVQRVYDRVEIVPWAVPE